VRPRWNALGALVVSDAQDAISRGSAWQNAAPGRFPEIGGNRVVDDAAQCCRGDLPAATARGQSSAEAIGGASAHRPRPWRALGSLLI
jgi:hypothetical protein